MQCPRWQPPKGGPPRAPRLPPRALYWLSFRHRVLLCSAEEAWQFAISAAVLLRVAVAGCERGGVVSKQKFQHAGKTLALVGKRHAFFSRFFKAKAQARSPRFAGGGFQDDAATDAVTQRHDGHQRGVLPQIAWQKWQNQVGRLLLDLLCTNTQPLPPNFLCKPPLPNLQEIPQEISEIRVPVTAPS